MALVILPVKPRQPHEGGHVAQELFKQWKKCFSFWSKSLQHIGDIKLCHSDFSSASKVWAEHAYVGVACVLTWVGKTLRSIFFLALQSRFHCLLGGPLVYILKQQKIWLRSEQSCPEAPSCRLWVRWTRHQMLGSSVPFSSEMFVSHR